MNTSDFPGAWKDFQRERAAKVMGAIINAITTGQRCPSNEEMRDSLKIVLSGVADIMRMMTNAGMLSVEVYDQNWRVVRLNVGQHAGKATKRPDGNSPLRYSSDRALHYSPPPAKDGAESEKKPDRPKSVESPKAALPVERARAASVTAMPLPPAKTCQWLHGESRDRNFCGKPSQEGSSYCHDHHAICWTKAPRLTLHGRGFELRMGSVRKAARF